MLHRVLTDDEEVMQFLLNIAVDNSIMEKYLLQPVKSVLLYILNNTTRRATRAIQPKYTTKRGTDAFGVWNYAYGDTSIQWYTGVSGEGKYDQGIAYLV